MPTAFFREVREQSLVKSEIVEKYFDTWASIILHAGSPRTHGRRIGYVDLFAGPGRYQDGADSTPVKILQKAISNPLYAESLVTIFNDKDQANIQNLESTIRALPGINTLKTPPAIWNQEIGQAIAEQFASIRTIPILAFIDPWGYKGLSLKLVNAFVKDWGCDCIFFFNYGRINAGLSNQAVYEHMCALFGKERVNRLRPILDNSNPNDREAIVVNELACALKENGAQFVLPFCFKNKRGTRTSHHLVLVTKHFKGYEVMKDIMASYSSSSHQGVPSFVYSPAAGSEQHLLFELNRPLDDLRGMLLAGFAGKSMTMQEIYIAHSVDRPFIKRNYKEVLKALEDEGAIKVQGRKSVRGFADHLLVRFPGSVR
jgi:three-Cys-motif partner protein